MDSIRRLRTDQVGSLLRPQALLDARAAWQAGRLSEAGLSQLEDEAILTALRAQEAAGQQIYVDGEFRRTGFHDRLPRQRRRLRARRLRADRLEGWNGELKARRRTLSW